MRDQGLRYAKYTSGQTLYVHLPDGSAMKVKDDDRFIRLAQSGAVDIIFIIDKLGAGFHSELLRRIFFQGRISQNAKLGVTHRIPQLEGRFRWTTKESLCHFLNKPKYPNVTYDVVQKFVNDQVRTGCPTTTFTMSFADIHGGINAFQLGKVGEDETFTEKKIIVRSEVSEIDDQYSSNSEIDSGSAFGADSSDNESEDNKSESNVLGYSDEYDEMQQALYNSLQSKEFQHTLSEDELKRALEHFRHRRHEEIVARLTGYFKDLFADIQNLADRYRERFFASPNRIGALFRGQDIRILFEEFQNSGTIDVQHLVNNREESQQQENTNRVDDDSSASNPEEPVDSDVFRDTVDERIERKKSASGEGSGSKTQTSSGDAPFAPTAVAKKKKGEEKKSPEAKQKNKEEDILAEARKKREEEEKAEARKKREEERKEKR